MAENDRGDQNSTFAVDETDKKSYEESRYVEITKEIKERSKWNNEIEFLMSCIAISIGFGNIWRFPFTAYENGGGVFLIPYIIVLFLVGKPFYYMEIILGQFSSSSSINVWNVSPGFSGIGWSQFYCNTALMTYYSSLMALTLFFLIASFSAELPWAKCREEWLDYCIDSSQQIDNNTSNITSFVQLLNEKERRSSAELYFLDVLIVTTLDTLTSFVAGCTIFGILGNLAHKMGLEDISKVVKSGVGLAFISYPDAIAKFNIVPQLFAVLFFVMMFVLGVGSIVGMVSGLAHSLKEKLPNVQIWKIVLCICSMSFAVSTIYVTPGGQFLLNLVDYYGTSFVVFFLASFEITAIMWVYGIENFLNDVEFMLDRKTGSYWRICWFLVTPLILLFIFFYTFATLQPLTYGEKEYPISAHAAGIVVSCLGIFQIPFWMIVKLLKNRNLPLSKNIRKCFLPTSQWGPKDTEHRKDWLRFKEEKEKQRSLRKKPRWVQLVYILINKKETKE
ncbi:sodium-dependent nutrient amino acid transporter 1-like isoform X2 [Apis laboriosa]|uniref:sodium-dependent nutrient amino acid transporter 1-like isoform X2 n=1 Tax=Apis laboriosa TaxID=183418 RepID=UPI001CC641A8|nr:sodium-dependent nutrient amino acid transporter 1-like isoform X2 [Apis laboriosa]